MEKVYIRTEYIKLDQLLKWINIIESGAMAKTVILEGLVKVNGEIETRRGRKIYPSYIIEFNGEKFEILKEE